MKPPFIFVQISIMVTLFGCVSEVSTPRPLSRVDFQTEVNGKKTDLFRLTNGNNLFAEITNYGGRVVSLWVPDRTGNMEDIVLGYSNLQGYLNSNELYYGATIGRYGNRIARGQFIMGRDTFNLAQNNGEHHLHGGTRGFHTVVWDAVQPNDSTLVLTYFSEDGEEGYPGNLEVMVTYRVTEQNKLIVEYKASTDKPTPVNLTHHSFFNLLGQGNGSILGHEMQINADGFTPVDDGLIPTGEIAPVEGTPFDFRNTKKIGRDIAQSHEQLQFGRGYDHNWVVNKNDQGLNFAVMVKEPITGRVMKVFTNEPGLQFYGGNFLAGLDTGKNNRIYRHREAFCLETQHFPNSPNQPNFPSTVILPGMEYYSICIYQFLAN